MKTPLLLRTEGWIGRGIGLGLGALAVLGQAPFHLWPIALLSLACLFARLQWAAKTDRPGRRGFSTAMWWAMGYFAAGTFWVGSAFVERGPEFIPIMPFMVAGLAILLSVFWGLAGMFFARAKLMGLLSILVFAAAFTLAELTRGHIFGGFPWNLPAYIFEAGSRPSQSARWIGAYGLSSLVLLISAAFGQAIFWRERIWPSAFAVLSVIGLYGIGHVRLSGAELEYQSDVSMRIVSVPFKQSEMMSQNSSIAITNDFIIASIKPGIKDITHLVWPEGAVRGFKGPAMDDPDLLYAVGGLLTDEDATPPVWLMNSLQTERENGRLRYYNVSVAVTFDENGIPAVAGSNRKRKLVAFGEHIPFMDWFEDVQFPLISTNLASISPAKKKTLADFPGLPRLSPQLCYEVAFPGLTPSGDGKPAEFILNQSNDAWFGKSAGPAQHANIARYRAIETGLPIIRAASNGISGQIDPYGRIHGEVVSEETQYIDTKLIKPLKFNNKIKFVDLALLLISLLICVIKSLIRPRGVGLRV
ncbi:MAG: apolipoprotein N-acyltransferase [Litorimonas sp.]